MCFTFNQPLLNRNRAKAWKTAVAQIGSSDSVPVAMVFPLTYAPAPFVGAVHAFTHQQQQSCACSSRALLFRHISRKCPPEGSFILLMVAMQQVVVVVVGRNIKKEAHHSP